MGITIKSKNNSLTLGYGGFLNLRHTISTLCPKEIKDHYDYLINDLFWLGPEDFDNYDLKTDELYAKYPKFRKIINFLYAPDSEAVLNYGICKDVLNIIKNYDDDINYGYSTNIVTFSMFKNLLNDCVINKCKLRWR